MTKIDEIPTEVFCIILEYVCNTSPGTARSLMLVNKFFRASVQVISHRCQKFVLSGSIQASMASQQSLQDPVVLKNVRHLTVANRGLWETIYERESPESYVQFLQRFEPFNDYIRSIQNLQTLTWTAGPVPETLVTTLTTSHPRATLKVFNFARFWPSLESLDKSELALSNCTALTHLHIGKVTISSFLRPVRELPVLVHDGQLIFDIFLKIILHARNLEYAGLLCWLQSPYKARPLPNVGESLKSVIHHSIKQLTLDVTSLTLDEPLLQSLQRYVGSDNIRSFKFSRGILADTYFQSAASVFPKIRHVSLNLTLLEGRRGPIDKAQLIKQYLLECSSLETLSVWSWSQFVDIAQVLDRHGVSLRVLQLHDKYRSRRQRVLTTEELQAIGQSCLRLQDMTIDLILEGPRLHLYDQPELCTKLGELTRFQSPLQTIRLYYGANEFFDSEEYDSYLDRATAHHQNGTDSEIDETNFDDQQCVSESDDQNNANMSSDAQSDPDQMAEDFVVSIWKRVYGSRTTGERCLEVKFGEWEAWEDHDEPDLDPRRFYLVLPHERDDMLGECTVKCYRKQHRAV